MQIEIEKSRILHMHGVAELMYKIFNKFSCSNITKDEAYFLGLVHDIGYLYGKDGHEITGGHLLFGMSNFGVLNKMSDYVKYHELTPREYMEVNNCSASEIPNEMILLWYANMCIESDGELAGEEVGFDKRLESIKENYGEDSDYYKSSKETIDWLREYSLIKNDAFLNKHV